LIKSHINPNWNKICEKCGVWIPSWLASDYYLKNLHKCDYFFWRRIKEFGECIKG